MELVRDLEIQRALGLDALSRLKGDLLAVVGDASFANTAPAERDQPVDVAAGALKRKRAASPSAP